MHTSFNFHDSLLHSRLIGLLAVAVTIACLAIIELRRPPRRLVQAGLGIVMAAGLIVTLKILIQVSAG